jgi:FkbM family methyltransferase
MTGGLRRLARATGLQRVLEHPRVEPLVALLLRAATVRGSARFVGRELARRRTAATYRLRAGDVRVVVRHATPDVITLGEVFDKPDYAPPDEVRALLGDAPRILDLGANIGLFGAYALLQWPRATVTGFEPDPGNAAIHRATLGANGFGERWTLVEAAGATADGTLRFAAGDFATSHVAESGGIEVAARDVVPQVRAADLVKLDIEGGEWPILLDARLDAGGPKALVLEYHPEGAPGPPRESVERRLAELGYATAPIWHRPDGYGMLWGWRRP